MKKSRLSEEQIIGVLKEANGPMQASVGRLMLCSSAVRRKLHAALFGGARSREGPQLPDYSAGEGHGPCRVSRDSSMNQKKPRRLCVAGL
jgi:hypothetical protein